MSLLMDALRKAENPEPDPPGSSDDAVVAAALAEHASLELEPVEAGSPTAATAAGPELSAPGDGDPEQNETAARERAQRAAAVMTAAQPSLAGRIAFFLAGFMVVALAVGGYYLYRLDRMNAPSMAIPVSLPDAPAAAPPQAAEAAATVQATAPQPAEGTSAPPAAPETSLPNTEASQPPPEPQQVATETGAVAETTTQRIEIRHTRRPSSVHPLIRKAYRAYRLQNYGDAEQLYRRALQRYPRNRDALLGLGAIAVHRGNRRMARYYYEQVLKADPANRAALVALQSVSGAQTLEEGSRIKHWLQSDRDNAQLHFALGNRYAAAGQWKEAQQAYFDAFNNDPDNPDYAFNLAVSLDQLNLPGQALDYYLRAVELARDHAALFSTAAATRRIDQLRPRPEQRP